MTAVPFFSAARAGIADRDVEGPSLMAFSRTFKHRGIALSPAPVWYAQAGAAVYSQARRCGGEKRPRRSSLMILLISRFNAGSAPRDRRERSVGPSEGRATVTRSSVVFGLGLQSEID